MQKSRALKYGQLEKAQQIQNEIENLSVDLEKNKNVKESFLTATKELDKMRNDAFDVRLSQAHTTTIFSGGEPVDARACAYDTNPELNQGENIH